MPVQNITFQPVGLVGVKPELIYIETDDTYATVTATGYLNNAKARYGNNFNDQQMAEVYTTDEGPVWLKVVVTTTDVSLVQLSSPGDVVLPTIANHIMVSTDTAGTLSNLTGTAINNGSLQAGLSGTAGSLISYSSTGSKGYLALTAVANTGNTATVISNAAMGQASVISIPDPGNAVARFLVGATATPFTSGNFPVASGTAGLMVDSGLAAANIQNKTNIKAAQVTGLGGAGAGPITVTAAGCTTSSVICASIITSSNAVSIVSVTPGTGNFALTLSADPGATLSISYIMFIAAQ